MRSGIFHLYLIFTISFFSFSATAQEEASTDSANEEEKKVNVNGLHFFHQYSFENSFAEFDKSQQLRGKTAFSMMPFFGVGIKRETEHYVFAFSSKFGFQRDNMTFSYAGQKLAGTYAMDYMSVRRQFALGFRITPEQTFSLLLSSSYNEYGMGATPYERRNLRKLEQKDKLQIGHSYDPFLDFRLGFEYEYKPMDEKKLRLFFYLETSLKQRRVEVEPNYHLGIGQPYTVFYRLSVFGFGMRF